MYISTKSLAAIFIVCDGDYICMLLILVLKLRCVASTHRAAIAFQNKLPAVSSNMYSDPNKPPTHVNMISKSVP